MSEVYYRIYVPEEEKPCVVCMQHFDEEGYDQNRFLTSHQYESEDEATKELYQIFYLMRGLGP